VFEDERKQNKLLKRSQLMREQSVRAAYIDEIGRRIALGQFKVKRYT
jgi:hypothetical protein